MSEYALNQNSLRLTLNRRLCRNFGLSHRDIGAALVTCGAPRELFRSGQNQTASSSHPLSLDLPQVSSKARLCFVVGDRSLAEQAFEAKPISRP